VFYLNDIQFVSFGGIFAENAKIPPKQTVFFVFIPCPAGRFINISLLWSYHYDPDSYPF